MKISAIVITKNEEKMIGDCLNSLSFADEIILVDTGNTDKTNDIAKKDKARIIKFNGKGSFADWRNKGLKMAKGDWIIYLDADERVTKELQKEILDELPDTKFNAFAIARRNFIFGKEFKHSGQYPDYQKRVFRKSTFRKWSGDIHEEPSYEGDAVIGHLQNPMLHLKNMTLSQMVEKTNKWSEIEAKLMFDAKHPPMTTPRFFSAMAREFWKRMIIEMAFLDGALGIIYAIYQVFSKFTSYAKLYEMQIGKKQ